MENRGWAIDRWDEPHFPVAQRGDSHLVFASKLRGGSKAFILELESPLWVGEYAAGVDLVLQTNGGACGNDTVDLFCSRCVSFFISSSYNCSAQQTLGAITGTVSDPSGAAIPDATVKAINVATNLEVVAQTKSNGSFLIPELPAGTYKLTITKEGFKSLTHTEVLVNADRTTTVDSKLLVGSVSPVVEVNAVPLMNQTDTTNGYVVDQLTIQDTPLGTGSFTQLAILSPGVHADFLGGAGSNAGLGNQAIFANGNRDTSNSFSLNGSQHQQPVQRQLHQPGGREPLRSEHR